MTDGSPPKNVAALPTAQPGSASPPPTIGQRLAEYSRMVRQTNLIGAGLAGGVALFNGLHFLTPFAEAIVATLFVITVIPTAGARGQIDFQVDLITRAKDQKKVCDTTLMCDAKKANARIQEDLRLARALYIAAGILVYLGALVFLVLEWHSVLNIRTPVAATTPAATSAPMNAKAGGVGNR
jgi:hypothetical protein